METLPHPTDPQIDQVAHDSQTEARIERFLATQAGQELRVQFESNVISDVAYQTALMNGAAGLTN